MKQLVVISGKGGTGKTSLVASFASLAKTAVLADCDVDAADLHLVVRSSLVARHDFRGGKRALIDSDRCSNCGICEDLCRFEAINSDASTTSVDPIACEGCGVCAWFCSEGAIDLVNTIDGEWYLSETRLGPMVHARLKAAGENSGKLVSLLRSEARNVAKNRDIDLVLIDGSPGIGCPVIASITGADLVLVVTEPTLSGLHDLERVIRLTSHFGIPTKAVVNRFDINEKIAMQAEKHSQKLGAELVGRIRFDPAVTQAQIQGVSVIEHSRNGAAADITEVWQNLQAAFDEEELYVSEA
ncbi:MAG: ATP-binding protein [Acidobacteria bacterium]|nr:ATP-binding protein [Acidobacteriota bacterium]